MIQSLFCVIVNWNLKEDTIACIESLFEAGAVPGQVVVVDNGSTDGSVQALKDRFKNQVRIISSHENLGFAVGNNLGIQQAMSEDAEWILLINNDTLVAPTFLSELENFVAKHEEFDILGPLIFYDHQPARIWYLGDRLIPGTLITYSLYRNQMARQTYPEVMPVDFITGCAMLINKRVFETVGLLDTNLFMYGEDVDFCWRARQAGFKLAAAPRARMWHKVSTSAQREKSKHRYLRTRNQNRFYRVYSRGLQLPVMVLFSLLQLVRQLGMDIFNLQFKLFSPLIRGWLDGWLKPHQAVTTIYGKNDLQPM